MAANSNVVAGSVSFIGMSIHDPEDPNTAIYLQYSVGGRQASTAREGTKMAFAGRRLPVYDFGEQREDTVAVDLQVPFDEQDKMVSLEQKAFDGRVYCYRDNRGRVLFGILSKFEVTDEMWGWTVSIAIDRVDFEEA